MDLWEVSLSIGLEDLLIGPIWGSVAMLVVGSALAGTMATGLLRINNIVARGLAVLVTFVLLAIGALSFAHEFDARITRDLEQSVRSSLAAQGFIVKRVNRLSVELIGPNSCVVRANVEYLEEMPADKHFVVIQHKRLITSPSDLRC